MTTDRTMIDMRPEATCTISGCLGPRRLERVTYRGWHLCSDHWRQVLAGERHHDVLLRAAMFVQGPW